MANQYKFRFWDTRGKKWCHPDDHKFGISLTDEGFEYSTGWDGLDNPRFGTEDEDGYSRISDETYTEIQNNYKASHYTGITDSERHEIYFDDLREYKGKLYKIVMDYNRIVLQRTAFGFGENETIDMNEDVVYLSSNKGNIYENPEFIK